MKDEYRILQESEKVFYVQRRIRPWFLFGFKVWKKRMIVDDWGPLCPEVFSSLRSAQNEIQIEIAGRKQQIKRNNFKSCIIPF